MKIFVKDLIEPVPVEETRVTGIALMQRLNGAYRIWLYNEEPDCFGQCTFIVKTKLIIPAGLLPGIQAQSVGFVHGCTMKAH